jgi:heme exporter protein B
VTQVWWLFQKELVGEYRTHSVWPRTVLVGLVVAFLLSYQTSTWSVPSHALAATLFWLTMALSAVLSVGQSGQGDQPGTHWEAVRQYPVPATSVYWAKLAFHFALLGATQIVIALFYLVICQVSWWQDADAMVGVGMVANLGLSSVTTIVGGLVEGHGSHRGVLTLLTLPLLLPLILAASEATRLVSVSEAVQDWWLWMQLLIAFATIYTTAGWMLFEYVMEE